MITVVHLSEKDLSDFNFPRDKRDTKAHANENTHKYTLYAVDWQCLQGWTWLVLVLFRRRRWQPIKHHFYVTTPRTHPFHVTTSRPLHSNLYVCRKSLGNNKQNQFFWACKNEHPQETIILAKSAGQQPMVLHGHCWLIDGAATEKKNTRTNKL